MKNKRIWLLSSIVAIVAILAVILVLSFNYTYVGENGLKEVIFKLILSLVFKVVVSGCMGIMVFAILIIIFRHRILKNKIKQVGYNSGYYTSKDIDKRINKYIVLVIIMVIIIYCVFSPGKFLSLHKMQSTDDFKFANDIVLLVSAINDLSQNETYDISAKQYSYVRLNIKVYTKTGSNTTSETYIKFDDENYIIVGYKDQKFIEDNWNEDGINTVTLYKNSGIICKINGKTLN